MPPLHRETRRETRLPTQRRALAPTPQSYDADTHTVDLVASAGADVRRYGWDGAFIERLDVNGALLGRVEAGQCPLLDSHNAWSIDDQIGVVTGARVENGSLITTVRSPPANAARRSRPASPPAIFAASASATASPRWCSPGPPMTSRSTP